MSAHYEMERSPAAGRELVREAVLGWGGSWDEASGALELPLLAGVRRGVARGTLTIEEHERGCRAVLSVHEETFSLRGDAVVVLCVSAAGALSTVVWPVVPALLPFVPFGVVLALAGWFLVISRLVTNRPEDVFETLAELEKVWDADAGRPR